ncbi:glutamate receptor ionotropic, kainate 2 [Ixodes scapularis]
MGWLFFAYVYEGDQALVRLQEMERHEDIMGRKVLAFDLGAAGQPADRRRRRQTDAGEDDAIQEPKTVWDEIKESGYRNFIIDLPQDRIAGVLQEAKDAGLMTELHNFLITTLDFHVVNTKDLRNEDARIYSFRLLHLEDDDFALMSRRLVKYHPDLTTKSEEKETEVGLIYDAIHVLAEVLHNASKDGADFKFNAVECDNGTFLEDGQKLLDTFKGTTYDGFTGEIQFDEDGMREVDSLTLWQLHKGRSEHVATWSPEKGLDFVHDPHDDDGVPGSEDVDDTIDENSLENRTIIVTTVVVRRNLRLAWRQE